ncbi:CAU/MBL1b family subclass B3 metallo-beta-lactamase [Sphingomonas oligophenolica]|uniref:Subclass B3 metallo-beta-lactamase n=1 Tax=Sphingomonas oligophenolica TaxID=301154 RepID=A0ABU9Y1E3_9SPHN
MKIRPALIIALGVLLSGAGAGREIKPAPYTLVAPAEWSQPVAPFHIAGPVWYVGTRGIAVYAILSKDSAILVGGPMTSEARLIERNLATIGVKKGGLKLLLNMHAHFDHAGALAQIKRDTGARLIASAGDRPALEAGRHQGDNSYGRANFPAVKVDRVVRDGEIVRLGAIAVTTTLTPGHTIGCTTWSLPVHESGRTLQVVFPCSVTVAGNRLIGNRGYPGIVAAYRRSFARLDAMHADIVLPSHPEIADVMGREARRAAGDANAFVDPGALHAIVVQARKDFDAALAKEGTPSPHP